MKDAVFGMHACTLVFSIKPRICFKRGTDFAKQLFLIKTQKQKIPEPWGRGINKQKRTAAPQNPKTSAQTGILLITWATCFWLETTVLTSKFQKLFFEDHVSQPPDIKLHVEIAKLIRRRTRCPYPSKLTPWSAWVRWQISKQNELQYFYVRQCQKELGHEKKWYLKRIQCRYYFLLFRLLCKC